MTYLTIGTAILASLGAALIGGVFFAFSSFVMKALARVPPAEGIAAMQSINVVVLNPSFLGVFTGTAVLSLLIAAVAATGWGTATAPWFLAGAVLYVAGTFLVTALGNVPLNKQLAAVAPADAGSLPVWEDYLDRWTRLNTIRACAAMASALMFIVGLIRSGIA